MTVNLPLKVLWNTTKIDFHCFVRFFLNTFPSKIAEKIILYEVYSIFKTKKRTMIPNTPHPQKNLRNDLDHLTSQQEWFEFLLWCHTNTGQHNRFWRFKRGVPRAISYLLITPKWIYFMGTNCQILSLEEKLHIESLIVKFRPSRCLRSFKGGGMTELIPAWRTWWPWKPWRQSLLASRSHGGPDVYRETEIWKKCQCILSVE